MKRMLLAGAVVVLALTSIQFARAQEAAEPPAAGTVLDESCYWRMYVVPGMIQLSANELKNNTSKVLDQKMLDRLEQVVKKHQKSRNIDWSKTDWRDVAYIHFLTGDPDNTRAMEILNPVFPPAEWYKPDFDDTTWLRQRIAQLPHDRPQLWPDLTNQAFFLRTIFTVPDPSKVKDLKLHAVFRGGVRVFVNGKELTRANLPAGELTAKSHGEDYPEDAYRAYIDEVTDPQQGRRVVPDLRMPFNRAPQDDKNPKMKLYRYAHSHIYVNEKGWTRMMNLRDRQMGPVVIPADMLVKGVNVLAVEVRTSEYHPIVYPGVGGERFGNGNWRQGGGFENYTWTHARLIRLELTDAANVVPPALQRPEGLQVWAEDMHARLFTVDYFQPGGKTGAVRMAGCPNGTYGGQFVVGSSADLTGLKVTAGELKSDKGAIPTSAIKLQSMLPETLAEIYKLGSGRGVDVSPVNNMSMHAVLGLSKNPALMRSEIGGVVAQEMKKYFYFDHLTDEMPSGVKADSCQPFWVSVKVPEGTPPGKYAGSVTVECANNQPVSVPVEIEVADWRMPSQQEFQTDAMLTQSQYALVKRYKVPVFSDEHFRLMETSLQQLARVGNDCLFIPVLAYSEFGNLDRPGLIKWTRHKDGTVSFDYKNLDRYLDLAVKYLGKPRIVSFGIMHWCMASPPPRVLMYNEATNKDELVGVGWKEDAQTRIALWKSFCTQLVEHMKTKGLEDSVYWGHAGDPESDPALIGMLGELFPSIYWTACTHSYGGGAGGGGHDAKVFRAVTEIYAKPYTETSYKGWVRRGGDEKFFDGLSDRNHAAGLSAPFPFRTMADYALHLGYTGVGGMGFDYYDLTWNEGYGGTDWCCAGLPFFAMSWPGKKGVESSVRYETLIESIQDTEQRIFIEQTLERKVLPDDLAAEANKAIMDRYGAFLCRDFNFSPAAQNYVGWQNYSRQVGEACAKVAAKVGVDAFRTAIKADVPALGKKTVTVTLRNWTSKPRQWKVAASDNWIVPEKAEGSLSGHERLNVLIDASAKKPGDALKGTLTVTDVTTGATTPVEIAATIGAPMEMLYEHLALNVPAGESDTIEVRVVNYAASEQPWALKVDAPWIKAEPASGKLSAGASTYVRIKATPAEKDAQVIETPLNFTGAGDLAKQDVKLRTFIMPAWKDPGSLPMGRVIKLEKMESTRVTSHKSLANGDVLYLNRGANFRQAKLPRFGDKYDQEVILIMGKKKFDRGMWCLPTTETTYNLEGGNFTAFAAYVGVVDGAAKQLIRNHERKVNFEIWVDGKLKTQSGLMTTFDPSRLLVADLTGAKQIKLVTRLDSARDNPNFVGTWANGEFYTKE